MTPQASWRWCSTAGSSEQGVFSVLALVATILTVGISVWIAWTTKQIYHIAVGACRAPYFVLIFPSPILHRCSLKRTPLLWSPLLWIVLSIVGRNDVKIKIEDIPYLVQYRLMRWYSGLVLILLAGKGLLAFGIISLPLTPPITAFLGTDHLPMWQLAAAANTCLAFILFFVTERRLLRFREGEIDTAWHWRVSRYLSTIKVVRTTLTLYIITCSLYIAWTVAHHLNWPPSRSFCFCGAVAETIRGAPQPNTTRWCWLVLHVLRSMMQAQLHCRRIRA